MRVLGLDTETTGLDTANDRIVELGVVLWEVEEKKPVVMANRLIIDEGIAVRVNLPDTKNMMARVSGITEDMLTEFGHSPVSVLNDLEELCAKAKPSYIIAHNGENFDRPLLMAELNRHNLVAQTLRELPWIDTRADIPYEVEPDSRRLRHLALDCGFMNPFEHRAVTDVLTMLKVLGHHDIQKIIEYQKIPFVVARAVVSYDDRQLAKDRRYSWEQIGDKKYPKMWVKRIKLDKLEQEMKEAPFQVVRLE